MNEQARRQWSKAAAEYQRVYLLGEDTYDRACVAHMEEEGLLPPGARVLDVGCGVGRYGVLLSQKGCRVTLTDISPRMLAYAARNMAGAPAPWRAYACDFADVTGAEPVFAGGFDLVLSTLSPAVETAADIRRMSALSRGKCFVSRFCGWSQPLTDQLRQAVGMGPSLRGEEFHKSCWDFLWTLMEEGFVPQVKQVDYCWREERSPQEAAARLARQLGDESLVPTLEEAAQALAGENGRVADPVNARAAWIWWEV